MNREITTAFRRNLSVFWVVVVTALATAFAPVTARAADQYFEFKGQKIYYENAEHHEAEDAGTGETVHFLVFREDGWFKPTKTATGRALVVGGGGAGGYGTTTASLPGGGGGGGGGGGEVKL